jgi:hypothetical protein
VYESTFKLSIGFAEKDQLNLFSLPFYLGALPWVKIAECFIATGHDNSAYISLKCFNLQAN